MTDAENSFHPTFHINSGMIQDLYLRRLNHNISSPLPAFPRHLVPIFSTSKYFLTEHFDFDTYQPHTAGSIPKKRTREPRERRVERADVATSLSDRTIITSQSYLSYSSSKNCFLCGIMVSSAALILNKLRRLRSCFAFFCFVGIALSSYAFYVETKKEHDDSYVAMCDINEFMSCTKVFSSKYGKGFGLLQYVLDEDSPLIQPNPVYGAIFYGLVLLLGLGNYLFLARVQMLLCIMANLGSVYLGYILYFVLEDICVVCISTYFVNFVLLIVTFLRISKLKQLSLETGGPILQTGGFNKTKKRV